MVWDHKRETDQGREMKRTGLEQEATLWPTQTPPTAGTRGHGARASLWLRTQVRKLTSAVGERSHIRKGFQRPSHCRVRPLSLSLASNEGRQEPTLAAAQDPGNLSCLTVEKHGPDSITTGYYVVCEAAVNPEANHGNYPDWLFSAWVPLRGSF